MSPRVWAFVVALHAAAFAMFNVPGYFSVDDIAYDWQAASFAAGRLSLENGAGLPPSAPLQVELADTVMLHGTALQSKYPPLPSLLAAPLHPTFGYQSLLIVSALGWVGMAMGTARLARNLGAPPLLAVALLGTSWVWLHAVDARPHALAGALGLWAFLLVSGAPGGGRAFAAGLLMGAAINARLDAVLGVVPMALALALARPVRWREATWLGLGLALPVFALALVNMARFGRFDPFSYGSQADAPTLQRFIPMGVTGACAAAGLVATRWLPRRIVLGVGAAVLLGVALLPALREVLLATLRGAWVLGVDLRLLSDRAEPGMMRGRGGEVVFGNTVKLALLQASPVFVLGFLAPLLPGEHRRARLVAAVLPVVLLLGFGRASWHGGFGFSPRYLLPATPFLAALSAAVVASWVGVGESGRTPAVAGAAVGLAGVSLLTLGRTNGAEWSVLSSAPLLFAGALAFVTLAHARFGLAARLPLALVGVSVAWGLGVLRYDLAAERVIRERNLAFADGAAAHIEPGSLLLSCYIDGAAPLAPGVAVATIGSMNQVPRSLDLLETFLSAGRPVYAAFPRRIWKRLAPELGVGAPYRAEEVAVLPASGLYDMWADSQPERPILYRLELGSR